MTGYAWMIYLVKPFNSDAPREYDHGYEWMIYIVKPFNSDAPREDE